MTAATLTQEFLDRIEAELTEKKTQLENELGGFTKPTAQDSEDFEAQFPEFGDKEDENAREIEQYTARKPLEITLEKELRDVNKALKRLADKQYGVCKYCENLIDEKRLLARPTSASCVSCKKTLNNEL
ncbi:MAG: hypothetical protein COU33_03620 [Candidatus Magasanikbacteria bacterium CG10_big_fil_rev_8_21_14_0_10_43_6]|uniref:Zinc finger DksA/TraR C4-type domain-containing protein n=1 Tax=Candidatus Magasanikbacteria bacterium CG10_big_fil_rev_8_21_14_0_10_43_6 TaxID=1974650 RepID=A0A2M6W0Q7_9BACT|nr:MAG: hypothetical protein COU33_03620 [Candidatus Magasanikbacteria bacterium CG10_big_fil_rev_8_21_14_0_10_43_6]